MKSHNHDEMLQTMQDIRALLAGQSGGGRGAAFPRPNLSNLVITESAEMPEANSDGTISVPAHGEADLVSWDTRGAGTIYLHAIGASDHTDLEYVLYVDEDIAFSTASPLGLITSPYSFTNSLGGPLKAGTRIRYAAHNTSGSKIDTVARMFVTEE